MNYINTKKIREEFPFFRQNNYIYFDNAATTQKPQIIIDSLVNFYTYKNTNVYRGTSIQAHKTTEEYELSRDTIKNYIDCDKDGEVVWTSGATESINLVASSYLKNFLKPNDEVIISEMEHHSNLIPWKIACNEIGAKLKVVKVNDDFIIDINHFKNLINAKTKFVAVSHINNITGYRNPIEKIIEISHKYKAKVLIDGSQGIVHEKISVRNLKTDFYVFSGHKIFAPYGIGILYAKKDLLEKMPPFKSGGKMVKSTQFNQITLNAPPLKFEAGTPNISGAIALAEAINWYSKFDLNLINKHLHHLSKITFDKLKEIPEVSVLNKNFNTSIISFYTPNINHYDLSTLLSEQGVAIRSGYHCAEPFFRLKDINGSIRISFALYNTVDEIYLFIKYLKKAIKFLE